MTVIGGPYSFLGPLVGAFVYEYLHWFIDQIPALQANWQLVFGVILLVVVLFFDNGVAGGIGWLRNKLAGKLESVGTETEAADNEDSMIDD